MTTVIETHDLRKTYSKARSGFKVEAVRGVTISVNEGCCFGLLGPNGAGKSTLLKMLEGLARPTSGKLLVFGMPYEARARDIRARTAGILQENRMYGKLRVREVLELFQSLYPRSLEVDAVLKKLSLTGYEQRPLIALSGGQRQRVFLGSALIGDPDLVFLDEPTTGLDPKTRREFWDVILDLKSRGKTVILSTHAMDEAEKLCDELMILDQGVALESGPPEEIIERVMKGRSLPVPPPRATLEDVFLTLTGRSLEEP